MMKALGKIKAGKYIIWGIKLIVCLFLLILVGKAFFLDGIKPYYSYKDYTYQNDFSIETATDNSAGSIVTQGFIAPGDILSNITIYLGDISIGELSIQINNLDGKMLATKVIDLSDYSAWSWNTVALDATGLTRGSEYNIVFYSDDAVVYTSAEPGMERVFTTGIVDGNQVAGSAAIGFQFTYQYLTSASVLELLLKLIIVLCMTFTLCFSVCRIEILYDVYKNEEKKQGVLYAIYFAATLVLLFNPLDTIKNEVIEFGRVFGSGLIANVDVSRRISNFSHWFIYFALFFALFFLLANYLRSHEETGERARVRTFLDNAIVLVDLNLILRCITYFYDESVSESVFYYSTYLLVMILIAGLAYLFLHIERQISAEKYAQLMLCGFSISYPIAIVLCQEWKSGKILIGIQVIIFVVLIVMVKFNKIYWEKSIGNSCLVGGVMTFGMLPFMTSFYIEILNILNQHSIFVAHPRKYYIVATILACLAFAIVVFVINKKKWSFSWWKRWTYPWIIFGVSCLSVQIALEGIYGADMFESANSSILVSDFLNFGSIPIVEHYSGHMMTGVWEGLIYALLNNDYAGAIFSSYSVYLLPFLAVLFFYLVKTAWNEDIALWVTLLFPFYNFWSYFGLGMLICLAVMSYVKKNTYPRAILIWFAFIWCAVYRLDLGYAFGIACIIVLIIYIIIYHNWKAIKQLVVSLLGWIAVGSAAWFGICTWKGINPINRLKEFLLINLSNLHWAYVGIGNKENTLFFFSYIFIPFIIIVCLLYTIISRKFREEIGAERWILLLLFGFSYFENFPRGLVRHSLAEPGTTIVLWSAYIFLAIFFSCFKKDRKLFLATFAILILCNTLFIQGGNFTAISISDTAASNMGPFVESWTLGRFAEEDQIGKTYWEQLAESKKVVNRTEWNDTLKNTVYPYQSVTNILLENDETFVDFINKTFVYSAINRKNPVYVSQSPLQLSGEFTQEQFIREITENIDMIPIVLMPIEISDNKTSTSLDGVANAYRYYKVAEFIYDSYVPLCNFNDEFAVWCLPDRYEDMLGKLESSELAKEYNNEFIECGNLALQNCTLERNTENNSVTIAYTGEDPFVDGLQKFIDLESYGRMTVKISIDYETDIDGILQLFYTTGQNELYTQDKSYGVEISGKGTAEFTIPTLYSRLRLDIPEGSIVKISSLKAGMTCSLIDYGYDGPIATEDNAGNISWSYVSSFHNYSIGHLARIWAESDTENASSNSVLTELVNTGGIYTFDNDSFSKGGGGNYLLVSASYAGTDQGGSVKKDDEYISAIIILGYYENGVFIEKYKYSITLQEGQHDYLIRVSNDYYWYLDEVNAVMVQCNTKLHDATMKILEGD